jgi:SAM-dependent methyltransferase
MTGNFYDDLASSFHLIFADWQASMDRQGEWLASFIRAQWPETRSVLDAACGIGTQALPLAARGFRVTASDLSSIAVARAAREARARGVELVTAVADLRKLSHTHGLFDLVLACDNALPHLLSDAELLQALQECHACIRPGGGFLCSVRDYAAPGTGSEVHGYGVRSQSDGRAILFQVWDWDGPQYDCALYIVEERTDSAPQTRVFRHRYNAVPPARLLELMQQAGFESVRRVEGFVQPVLVGSKRSL